MLNTAITKKQKEVLGYIKDYVNDNKISPTVREIADKFGTQPSNAKRYLDLLQREGWLSKKPMKTRGIQLMPDVEKPISYLASPYSLGGDSSEEERADRFRMVTRQAWLLFKDGVNIYSPITHHHCIQQVHPIELDTDEWMKYDLSFLHASETLYVLQIPNWDKSTGVQREVEYAINHNIPIEYIDPDMFVLTGEEIEY
jgi:SOS-response transcriptional repressor LexA